MHLAVAVRGDRFVATAGEARLAAATFAARGAELGDIALPAPDRFAVRQFAVMETLLPTAGMPVVDAARCAALAFGFLSVVLLWPVLRALGAGPVPAAVAAGLIGVLPPVVTLHAGISAGRAGDDVAGRRGRAGGGAPGAAARPPPSRRGWPPSPHPWRPPHCSPSPRTSCTTGCWAAACRPPPGSRSPS